MALYQIADLIVEMELSGRTKVQAEPYLVDTAHSADIAISFEHEKILEKIPQLTDFSTAEYIGTGSIFAVEILRFNGFQFHASAVQLDGKAYLFSAPPGTGKSTHTEKWCRLFGAQIINDDKPVLRWVDNRWMVYGTPWSGKHDLSKPVGVPFGGLAVLQRGNENTIRMLSSAEAVPAIISQCLRFAHKGCMVRQLELIDKLLKEMPVWLLTCRNDDEAAIVSCGAMKNHGSKK
jgi:hypothetical protein